MLRDASQRAWAVEASALAMCCDAPQHEGEGARRILASGREEPTCGCAKRPSARSPCFRPVIYREPRNCNVSSVSAAFAHPGGGEAADQEQEPDQTREHRQHADAAHHARLARAQSEPIVAVVG